MRRYLPAAASGLLLLFAMPGNGGLWFLSLIALVPLLRFAVTTSPGRAFTGGLVTGLILSSGTLYWIPQTLVKYGNTSWLIGATAYSLLAGYMALYCGFFAAAVNSGCRIFPKSLPSLPFTAPLLWASLEHARGHLFTGFPWMDLGYAISSLPLIVQAADLFGHLGLSFFIVQVNCVLVLLLIGREKKKLRHSWPPLAAALACIAAVPLYSFNRLETMTEIVRTSPRLPVSVLQGNIDQSVKWSPAMEKKTLDIYGRLLQKATKDHTTKLVILPETALPFYPHSPSFLDFLESRPIPSPWILAGIPRLAPGDNDRQSFQLFNSAVLISPQGAITGWYAKNHLVPFGEYVPLAEILPIPRPLVEAAGSYTAGSPKPPLSCLGAKIGVLICFESIFPELAVGHARRGATLLVNITNDGWYDTTNVPAQTLAMTVVRAVETRRSIARAANTGISVLIDPTGKIIAQSRLKTATHIANELPLLTTMTVFSRWRHLWTVVATIVLCVSLGVVFAAVRNRTGSRHDHE